MDSGAMDIRDLLVLLVSIVIVAAIALVLNHPLDSQDAIAPTPVPPTVVSTEPALIPVTIHPLPTCVETNASPEPTSPPLNVPEPSRIRYTDSILGYPRHLIPSNMNIFGASEPPWKDTDIFPFAYVEENRGGITELFSVQYPIWRINATIKADTKPQYALMQWILVDAETGEIIEGGELKYGGNLVKNVQIAHTEMYFIITTRDVDRFSLTLETMAAYIN